MTTLKILQGAFVLAAVSLAIPTNAQTRGAVYGLGVNMGLASAQASIAVSEQAYSGRMIAARQLALAALKAASSQIDAINLTLVPALDGAAVKDLLVRQNENVPAQAVGGPLSPSVGTTPDQFVQTINPQFYSSIVVLRSVMTARLTKANRGAPLFVHAFDLGVNMAIAEAQATAGESARSVVVSALQNARPDALALQLDSASIDHCIELAKALAPMSDVYTSVLSSRSTLQVLLGN